ncbi:MAG: molybdenum cofactor biosynthesis protein MoeB [Flavobacteriales bacterium]|nr:MAG: molybdenum cofactor biosynthesis protein MoeB [Flavobacteriales bacterium]
MFVMMFTKEELERYSRHLIIPEFNIEGQKKLKAAKVLVVGAGGLGAPLLQYLAAAGVGTLGIVDFDVVDKSNLHRQVLFNIKDIGRPKTEVAKERLESLNPHITVKTHNTRFTSENALDIIKDYDLVADGTDNFPTRYLVNDACVILGKPNVYASIFRFEGQVSVFNYTFSDGSKGPNYRDLFPAPPPPGLVPSCAEGGVLGVLPGIIGSLQANEVIKVITGIGEPLAGRLFLFDALAFETRMLKINKGENSPKIEKLVNYEQFCGIEPRSKSQVSRTKNQETDVKEITVQELHTFQSNGSDFQLIDVREPYEHEICNLNGELIPLGEIEDSADKIASDKKVIIHCRSGKRSADAIKILESKYQFKNLYNLKGGILAYADEIDNSLAKY